MKKETTSRHDTEFWKKAGRARDKLVKQYINSPDVTLIDIGYAPEEGKGAQSVVLRIHVHEQWLQSTSPKKTSFSATVDGIPVVVIPGEYGLSDL